MIERLVDSFQPERGASICSDLRPCEETIIAIMTCYWWLSHRRCPGTSGTGCFLRVLNGVGASKDVIVLTHDEFESKLSVVTSLPATVEREGKLVYAA